MKPDAPGDGAPDLGSHRDEQPLPKRSRREVARDVGVFQLKLLADGFRDLLLSPISLILGLVGLLISKQPGEPFYRLLRAGKATETWLDLFGAAYPGDDGAGRRDASLKELEFHLRGLERNLKTEDYDQGTRDGIARVRDSLNQLRQKQKRTTSDTDDSADRSG